MSNHEKYDLAPFLLNSIPKSGTHLMKQILLGLPRMKHDANKGMFGHYEYQTDEQINLARNLSSNEFINGHLFYSKKWESFFSELNMKQILVIRDPRDIIVSYAYFIPTLPIHPLYSTFVQNGFTHRDRIKFLLEGGKPIDPKITYQPNVKDWFISFSEWSDKENVLTIRFEELLTPLHIKVQVINSIVRFLWSNQAMPSSPPFLVGKMIQNIDPATSPTYRKGKIGGWRDELDAELIRSFKEIAGDLLIGLQYEKDKDW